MSERRDFYVYALVDPRNGETFYVGKGCGRRHKTHVLDAKAGREQWNIRKAERIHSVLDSGMEVDVRILSLGMTEVEAFARERQLILDQRETLTNIAPGTLTAPERDYWFLLDKVKRIRKPTQWAAYLNSTRGYGPSRTEMDLYSAVVLELIVELRSAIAAMQAINITVPESLDAALRAWRRPSVMASTLP